MVKIDFSESPLGTALQQQVQCVDFESRPLNQLRARILDGKAELSLKPKQIITICLNWKTQERQ
jgi:hypothetical protein